jgi:pimeloyl-ACP methyl ester carboxylesterase
MTAAVFKSAAGEAAVKARYAEFLQHWPHPAEHFRLPTTHGETFAIAGGPKGAPAVILLHGSASNAASWIADARVLAEHFRVFAVDMIGEPGFSAPSRPALASGAYAGWLDEVRAGLGLERAALVGISLGGWLALEYAATHPQRVDGLVLLCPGGVGKHRNVLAWMLPLLLLGPWGQRRIMARMGGGPPPRDMPPEAKAFGEFMQLIFSNFRPRTERLPEFGDAALRRLTMPLMAILGAKDPMIDSAGVRERLERNVPHARVRWLPDAGHILVGHGGEIDAFLRERPAAAA